MGSRLSRNNAAPHISTGRQQSQSETTPQQPTSSAGDGVQCVAAGHGTSHQARGGATPGSTVQHPPLAAAPSPSGSTMQHPPLAAAPTPSGSTMQHPPLAAAPTPGGSTMQHPPPAAAPSPYHSTMQHPPPAAAPSPSGSAMQHPPPAAAPGPSGSGAMQQQPPAAAPSPCRSTMQHPPPAAARSLSDSTMQPLPTSSAADGDGTVFDDDGCPVNLDEFFPDDDDDDCIKHLTGYAFVPEGAPQGRVLVKEPAQHVFNPALLAPTLDAGAPAAPGPPAPNETQTSARSTPPPRPARLSPSEREDTGAAAASRPPAAGAPLRSSEDACVRGVTFAFLERFAEGIPLHWTIADVVAKVILPATAAHSCCYHDLIPPAFVCIPRLFISHTWSNQLHSLVDDLRTHFKGLSWTARPAGHSSDDEQPWVDGQALIWLDVFAINQHPYVEASGLLNDDVSRLADVIRVTQKTLFCLDRGGMILTRIWCLYEVWQTLLAKGAGGLVVLGYGRGAQRLMELIAAVDVGSAQASVPQDRDKILHQIRRSLGFADMNKTIKLALSECSRLEAENAVHFDADKKMVADSLFARAEVLLRCNRDHPGAAEIARKAIDMYVQARGASCVELAPVLHLLAACLQGQAQSPGVSEQAKALLLQEAAVAEGQGADIARADEEYWEEYRRHMGGDS